jgi:16S rRNA (guanine527-N7)-methyltransferase
MNFVRFADLLELWSPRMNLVSCGSALELIDRHFLDSLAIAPMLPDSGPIVDLGTGAGFPGLPLAISRPEQKMVLVEIRRRRVTFLREVRRTLGLSNVEVLEQRAEIPHPDYGHQATGVVSRAVWPESAAVEMASGWLKAEGQLFWMRSSPLPAAFASASIRRERTIQYRIGSGSLRSVEILSFPSSFVSRETPDP